jgi:hypothetical protein
MAETKVATTEMAVLPDDIIVVEAENSQFLRQRGSEESQRVLAVGLDSLVFPDDIIVVAEWHRRNQASWELWHWPSRDRFGPPVRRCEPSLAHVRGSSCS